MLIVGFFKLGSSQGLFTLALGAASFSQFFSPLMFFLKIPNNLNGFILNSLQVFQIFYN